MVSVIREFFDDVPNSLKNYLIRKFSESKKSIRLLSIITAILLIKIIYDIYIGYSNGLKLTNVIVWIPLNFLIVGLLIPAFLALFFISIIMKQLNEIAPKSIKLYYFKASCCLQVYFYVIYTILIYLLTDTKYDAYMCVSFIICALTVIVFFSLYFKNCPLADLLTTNWGFVVIIVLYVTYGVCIQLLLSISSITFGTIVLVGMISYAPYVSIYSMDGIRDLKQIDIENLKKYFVVPDSLFSCMNIIIVLSIIGGTLYMLNFEDVGKNILIFENTYTEIESPIEFETHKNADGYLLFKTIDQRHIAIAYKRCNKKDKNADDTYKNYIKILKGYKYVELDNLEISEHNYAVKVDK